jgi:GNAT superfamily N-acetyltransferase
MVFRGDPAGIRVNPAVTVRVATADDARTFAEIHSGGGWAKRLSLSTTMSAMLDEDNTFYLGEIDGRPSATLHLLRDGATAGIYAVATAKKQRGRGLATTLMARAAADARAAGCDVIALSTSDAGNVALYEAAGFARAYESILWTAPEEYGSAASRMSRPHHFHQVDDPSFATLAPSPPSYRVDREHRRRVDHQPKEHECGFGTSRATKTASTAHDQDH